MLAAMSQGDELHVRSLLEQRAHRADVAPHHTRYSAFSDRSDSPSLYSHFDSNYRNAAPGTPVPPFPPFQDRDVYDDHTQYTPRTPQVEPPPHTPMSPRQPTEAIHATRTEFSEDDMNESNLDLEDDEDDDDDDETRMSLLGPKMRVHSRAPWEEDGNTVSDNEDAGGSDNLSVFGGKKTAIRALGFGPRSPGRRPSFESVHAYKGKTSVDTISGGSQASNSRSAIHALAQASMSSTSLAMGPSPSSSRHPGWPSRDRSLSNASRPAQVIPRSPVMEHPSGRESPMPLSRRSASPHRPELLRSLTRSPSPFSSDADHAFVHPYANPALIATYEPEPALQRPRAASTSQQGRQISISHNDSVATLAASEETVTISHSSTVNSSSMASSSGLSSVTPPTSGFSIVSAISQPDLSKEVEASYAEKSKHQRRVRRETKFGPISAPAMMSNNNFEASKPYALISLEQAQARVKERNRSATIGSAQNGSLADENREPHDQIRARSSSTTEKAKQPLTHTLSDDGKSTNVDAASDGTRQSASTGPPPGKSIRPKRSGFMKLFNAREKDKIHDIPLPPLPAIVDGNGGTHLVERTGATSAPRQPMHRIPVPSAAGILSSSELSESKDENRPKRTVPLLTIKVSSPSANTVRGQDPVPRHSDSPKSSLKPPMMPPVPTSAPAGKTEFAELKLRPVSGFFSSSFAEHVIGEEFSPSSSRTADPPSLISPTSISSSDFLPSPVNANFAGNGIDFPSTGADDDHMAVIAVLKEQIRHSRKAWQRQIWELEGQVRDLKAEIDELKDGDVCEACGRGAPRPESKAQGKGVIHRPRAKTGCGARFASGNET